MIEKTDMDEYLELLEKNKPISSKWQQAVTYSFLIILTIFVVFSLYISGKTTDELNVKNDALEGSISNSKRTIVELNEKIVKLSSDLEERKIISNAISEDLLQAKDNLSALDYSAKGDIEDLKNLFARVRMLEKTVKAQGIAADNHTRDDKFSSEDTESKESDGADKLMQPVSKAPTD